MTHPSLPLHNPPCLNMTHSPHPYITHPTLPYLTHPTLTWPTPPLHDQPNLYIMYPTPTWPTPVWPLTLPLYDLLHPSMTHPIPAWSTTAHPCMTHPSPLLHDSPHPCMTHPTPVWHTPNLHDPPHPYMTHSTPAWPTPTPLGAPFGRHVAIWLFHFLFIICLFFTEIWMSDSTRFKIALGSHIEVLQWILTFADYWPITEFPAILKFEMRDTSFFWVTIVLGEPQLAKKERRFLCETFIVSLIIKLLNFFNIERY